MALGGQRGACRDRRPPLAETWSRAWLRHDAEAIAALYADTAVYRSTAFGESYRGLVGVRRFSANFPAGHQGL